MKVLCPSCERLVELVDLRVERGGLLARCPACGAEQRQELPTQPVTIPSPKAAAKGKSGKGGKGGSKKQSKPPQPAEDENDEGPTIILLTPSSDAVPIAVPPPGGKSAKGDKAGSKKEAKAPAEEENDEGQTIILLTPNSDAVPLAVAPPGSADAPRPATVARFEAPSPTAVAPLQVAPLSAPPPRRVVDAEFSQLLDQLPEVHPVAPPAPAPQPLRPRNTGANAVIPPPQPGVVRGSTIQIPPGHCPKCITLRAREALICPACGLVFANFRAEEHQPSAALESAWRGLEERWSRQEEHDKFLQLAFNMDELARAGRL